MFVDNEEMNRRYRGYNPEFYRRVQMRRAAQERIAKAQRRQIAQVRVREVAEAKAVAEVTATSPSREIVAAMAALNGLTLADILGPCRKRHICAVRQEAMRFIHETKGLSSTQLGRVFKRDHTTVLHALSKPKDATVLSLTIHG